MSSAASDRVMARKVHLHARDLEIIETLLERRVETLDWLHGTFWPEHQRVTARNRLNELHRAGYVQRISRVQPGRAPEEKGRQPLETFFAIGPKAAAALRLRGMAGEHLRGVRLRPGLPDSQLDHQLMVNRVGDWLGAKFLPGAAPGGPARGHRHRPDAAYRAREADDAGRDVVLVEIDLGHYSRQRILAKVATFLANREARAILFAVPSRARGFEVARWVREHYGREVMDRVRVRDFASLRAGARVEAGTEPVPADLDEAVAAEHWREFL